MKNWQEKPKIKHKSNHKFKTETKNKPKTKSCDEYFRECIKNQTIPKDTPPYLKTALKRALKEYNVGMKHEKSANDNCAEKYVIINEKPEFFPIELFKEKAPQIKDFLRNHRNIKVRFLMTCLMETIENTDKKFILHKSKLILIQKHT